MSKIQKLILPLLSSVLISACGTASLSYDQDQQRSALQRWSQCIDRQTQAVAIKVGDTLHSEKDECQGHKRDVLESFPPHLGSRVEQMLSERRQERTAEKLMDVSELN